MIQPTHASRRILLPAKLWFIYLSLGLAFMLNLLPFGYLPGIPDWVALTLVFWCIHQPQRVGMSTAFVFGLAMDVASASMMGQHSLAYVILAFLAGGMSRRVLWFPLAQQALHVLPILLFSQAIVLLVRVLTGGEFPGLSYFLGSLVAALLWYPLSYLLLLPQYQPEERDENRPI